MLNQFDGFDRCQHCGAFLNSCSLFNGPLNVLNDPKMSHLRAVVFFAFRAIENGQKEAVLRGFGQVMPTPRIERGIFALQVRCVATAPYGPL